MITFSLIFMHVLIRTVKSQISSVVYSIRYDSSFVTKTYVVKTRDNVTALKECLSRSERILIQRLSLMTGKVFPVMTNILSYRDSFRFVQMNASLHNFLTCRCLTYDLMHDRSLSRMRLRYWYRRLKTEGSGMIRSRIRLDQTLIRSDWLNLLC